MSKKVEKVMVQNVEKKLKKTGLYVKESGKKIKKSKICQKKLKKTV